MRHEDWCTDRDDELGDDGLPVREHASGTDACTGAAFDIGGVTIWLQRLAGAPVAAVVAGQELDRGLVLKLLAQLGELAAVMPA